MAGKARFLATEDKPERSVAKTKNGDGIYRFIYRFLSEMHPDAILSWVFDLVVGFIFFGAALFSLQLVFGGVTLTFFLLPFLHYYGWQRPWLRRLSMLPFVLIIGRVMLGAHLGAKF